MDGKQLPHLRTPVPGPRSVAWIDRLARHEGPGVTFRRPRPFAPLGRAERDPVVWARALGANVEDVDGNVYVDLTAAFGVASVGHAHPRVVAAGREQLGRLPHAMADIFPDPRRVELAERLCRLSGYSRVVFSTTGSDAVETAIKTARLATGRDRVLAFEGGYHGLAFGALAETAFKRGELREPFRGQLGPHVLHAPFGGELPSLEGFAAAIVEPVQGRGGNRAPPPGWLAELARRAREAGALLIFDEIYTGFGRTGRWFAFQHEGVRPDLLCVGKALAGGFPLSACLGDAALDAWGPSPGEAIHTQTYQGNPLGAAMALAALDVLEEERLPERAAELGAWLAERLAGLPGVRGVSGRGLMLGLRLPPGLPAARFSAELLQRGYIALPVGEAGDSLGLSPPLVIERRQLEGALRAMEEILRAAAPRRAAPQGDPPAVPGPRRQDEPGEELFAELAAFIREPRPGRLEELALRLYAYQQEHNPDYRAFAAGARPRSLAEIPAVPVALFRDAPLCCFPPEQARAAFRTSGTTAGRPGVHRMRRLDLYELSAREGFRRLVPGAPRRGLRLVPPAARAPWSSLAHMLELLYPGSPSFASPDGRVDAEGARRAIAELEEPVFLGATALALHALLAAPGDCPALPPGSMVMVTGGYKGRRLSLSPAELLERAAEALGSPLVGEYGMTELRSQLWTEPSTRLSPEGPFRPPPWLVPLAVDPATGRPLPPGQPGLLRFVDLANGDSVLAIETGDWGTLLADGSLLLHGRVPGAPARGCSLDVDEGAGGAP